MPTLRIELILGELSFVKMKNLIFIIILKCSVTSCFDNIDKKLNLLYVTAFFKMSWERFLLTECRFACRIDIQETAIICNSQNYFFPHAKIENHLYPRDAHQYPFCHPSKL